MSIQGQVNKKTGKMGGFGNLQQAHACGTHQRY
jgi:hypothetical protein